MFRVPSSIFVCSLIAAIPSLQSDVLADQAGPLRISGPVSVEVDHSQNSTPDEKFIDAKLPFPVFRQHVLTPPDSTEELVVEEDPEASLPAGASHPAEDSELEGVLTLESEEPAAAVPVPAPVLASESETVQSPEKSERELLPLGQSTAALRQGADTNNSPQSGMSGIARTAGATALVIGLILLMRFAFVKVSGATGGLRAQLGPSGKAPSGVLIVLGRYPVSRGMSLVLLQLDQRVLLLSQTSSGFQTLAELSDPDEVSSIIRKARDENGESLSAKFTGMLKKFESDPETIKDLDSSAEAQPVRLRFDGRDERRLDPDDAYSQGYREEKLARSISSGEDELRSRINRLREYGA